MTGILGTGLGVLNSIDAEVLANKLVTTTSNLNKLKHPPQSSLLTLGTNRWLLSNILPHWEETAEKDHHLAIDALGATQTNIFLALSCIQAQLWMQSMAATIIREFGKYYGTMQLNLRRNFNPGGIWLISLMIPPRVKPLPLS